MIESEGGLLQLAGASRSWLQRRQAHKKMTRGFRIGTLALLWLIPVLIFSLAFSWDWLQTWRAVHVPSLLPDFLDLRSIPAGLETLQKGGNPLAANPADPRHRPFNYPRVWLYLFKALGLNWEKMAIVGLLFTAVYLVCISYLLIRAQHCADMVVLLVASLSLAPLLAMERGNNDLFVFSLLFLGCMASNKNFKSGIFATAAMLKIYPLAAMAVNATRRPAKERVVPYFLTGAVLFLFALQWRDLALIARNTPHSLFNSYGVLALREHLLYFDRSWSVLGAFGWAVPMFCWLAGALVVATVWSNSRPVNGPVRNSQYAEMFSVFGALYVFTYAVGSNWDYRLILLLPTLPLALEMARIPEYRAWGLAHLALVLVAENAYGFNETLGHVAKFCLFLIILGLLTIQLKEFFAKREELVLAEARG